MNANTRLRFIAAVEGDGWRFRVEEVVRGADAMAGLESQSDSAFGVPPPREGEYLLVKVYVEPLTASAGALRRSYLRLVDESGTTIASNSYPRYLPTLNYVEPDSGHAGLWLLFDVASGQRFQLTLDRPQRRFLALE